MDEYKTSFVWTILVNPKLSDINASYQPNRCHGGKLLLVDASLSGQNGRHLADGIFKCIFMNEQFCILIRISLKFVPRDPIDSKSALLEVMAQRLLDAKPVISYKCDLTENLVKTASD